MIYLTRINAPLKDCHRSGNDQGKKFCKVSEKSGNGILNQEKMTF